VAGASERILQAAVEAATVHGLSRLSVGDVARRAGVSRPTVYKHFPSRRDLIAAAVRSEAGAMIAAVRAEVAAHGDPAKALEAGVLLALRLLRDHPLLDRIVRTEPETLVPLLTTDDGLILPAVRSPVEEMVAGRLPRLDPVTVRRLADILARLLISYALNAPDDPPEVVAALVAALLADGAASLPSLPARVIEEVP
jgi:AcrR family transcriptional regulator